MQKYKVEFERVEKFIVDVYAVNEDEAKVLAQKEFDNDNYQDTGDIETEIGTVYDVTNTDDPFYPVNGDKKD